MQTLPQKLPDIWYVILMVTIFFILMDSPFLNQTMGVYKEFCEISFVVVSVQLAFCGIVFLQVLSAASIMLCLTYSNWPYGCGEEDPEEIIEEKTEEVAEENTAINNDLKIS